jgi:hypothetical protein
VPPINVEFHSAIRDATLDCWNGWPIQDPAHLEPRIG